MEPKQKRQHTKITEDMVTTSYNLGKRLKNGKIEFSEGVNKLVDMGMNRNSAADYLYFYPKLMANERFTRTTNAFATKYFLERILIEEGKEGLATALNSLLQHIRYYETKAGVNVKNRRLIHSQYLEKLK